MDLPHDPHAEKATLGAVLTSPRALTDTAPLLEGTDFYTPAHELVWDTITALHNQAEPVDPITVAARMTHDGTLNRLPHGALYLHDLTAAVTVSTNATWHARIVRRLAAFRRIALAGARTQQLGLAGEGDPADIAVLAQAELTAAHRPDPTTDRSLIADLLDDAIDAIENDTGTGVPWPWLEGNRILAPASPGQLILFGARPSTGKSVAVVDVARHTAVTLGLPVVLHSLEMSRTEIIHRILSSEAKVPLENIRTNTLTSHQWERIARARGRLADAPLHIIDTPNVGIPDLQASVARHKPAMLLLDYIQLAATNPKLDRRQGLEEFSRHAKLLAKTAGIPVVMAAQLNRGPEQTDRLPRMSDLRETGALENDADVVVLLHRPDQADRESVRAGEIDMIVVKQRNGPTQTFTLAAQLHYVRFVDLAA